MQGFIKNITSKAKENTFFRAVLETGKYTQVVIMSIPQGGEIGEEIHHDTDQILFLVQGKGKVTLDGQGQEYVENDLVLVSAGVKHNFVNTGETDMKIITFYSPPHHPQGTIHETKQQADKATY